MNHIIRGVCPVLQYAILFSITLEMYGQKEVVFNSPLFGYSLVFCVQIYVDNGSALDCEFCF